MESLRGYHDDIAALLYLGPFIASGVYAIYLWAVHGASLLLPETVYLTVTRDPYVFVIGSVCVLLAVVLDVDFAGPGQRQSRVISASGNLLRIAVASLILSLFFSLYANGFHPADGVADLVNGRFDLIFPSLTFLESYLLYTPLKLEQIFTPRVLGLGAMFLVPLVVYELGKHSIAAGLGVGLALVVAGSFFFWVPTRQTQALPKQKPA